ncbi:MAG TPA: hypothetical protein VKK79_09305 [Candidatus Lokiarchaeia archaeon]|nr:hypothetical protein [Candidatus Lokiarchaeia archaeon]
MVGSTPLAVVADGGTPPTQSQVFTDSNGASHTFADHYWDINVTNNQYWDIPSHPEVNPMTTWENNTWNIKWISEGNFQMGFLAFVNKTGDNIAANSQYFTPAQLWWMHYYYAGHEMLIGNMLAAWFVVNASSSGGLAAPGDPYSPFMYFTQNNSVMSAAIPSLISTTGVTVTPLKRTVNASGNIIYNWAYNYTDIDFFVPHLNSNNNQFDWGFNYSDPGTYLNGSSVIGSQSFIYYNYTLTFVNASNQVLLTDGYISGPVMQIFSRQSNATAWNTVSDGTPGSINWIPVSDVLCQGNWAFILAGRDPSYNLNATTPGSPGTEGGAINASSTSWGLSQVTASVGGTPVFNFGLSQASTYTIQNLLDSSNVSTQTVQYASLNVQNSTFVNTVAGMPYLMGPFGHLLCAYAINQTNHFTNGITFDKAWSVFDASSCAALLVTAYPAFGAYCGGEINHDPTFTAYWTPGSNWNETPGIPGFSFEFLALFTILGVSVVAFKLRKRTLA